MTTKVVPSSSPASSSRPVGLSKGPSTQRIHKLVAVPGCKPNMLNDLLLLRPGNGHDSQAENTSNSKHVVFFHGDIQNFQEEMSSEPECAQWLPWSLEQVGVTLGRRFPGHHVWVVRASRMYLHKFSSYRNFVESNMFGAPEHAPYSPNGGALRHLRSLLIHGMERAGLPNTIRPAGGGTGTPARFSLTLVGFSKGCVVLNQVVYELAGALADPHLSDFAGSLSDMFWLDGGHPGGSETWVTDRRLLGQLATSGIGVHAHVTPYEVRDPMRAWVGREHASFVKTLEEFGARLYDKLHFEDESPSIENHFRVIQEF
ncbi:mitochondrial protein C2orf69 homolog [Phycodurus eques]|uniref:mitochondrial protein C2orf69 homolog n=1 Tax=Phycodurus eques TaxID=693459 RepID=UPI002ACD9B78|nr:mitochondrial protein C2orf69 homolog [Phycodurus eques]XP_061548778.1 mitochondrial protein C2orf69 homolog [Phycodurus eques]XP_061548779.1 mitochondrial protein C2orf69 homolog [Phycodurus eques]